MIHPIAKRVGNPVVDGRFNNQERNLDGRL